MHFALTDRGELALERFGEGTKEDMFAFAHPLLDRALDEAYGGEDDADYESLPPDRPVTIRCAVDQQRSRLALETAAKAKPETGLGRDVKGRTDMPTILIDRLVRKHATKTLKNWKGRGESS